MDTLKQQVADLSLYLEEERLHHRDSKRKVMEVCRIYIQLAIYRYMPFTEQETALETSKAHEQ